jgi:hypothetical protein
MRLVQTPEDRDRRAEGFLAHQLAIVGHVIEHRRRVNRALAVVAVKQGGAFLYRIVDPVLEQDCRGLVDDGADIGVGIHRIAILQLGRFLCDQRCELVAGRVDAQHALDRGAALSRILGAAGDGQFGRLVEVGVVHDDQWRIAAEFEHGAPITRGLGDILADRHAAGERNQVDVFVGQHFVAHVLRQPGNHRQHLRRQAGLVDDVGQNQRGQRRLLGGLGDHAVIGRDRRRDLVRDHVERVIERRDRRNRAQQRIALGEDLALLAVWGQVAGKYLAVVIDAQLAGEAVNVEGAPDFVQAVFLAEAALGGDQVGDLRLALDDNLGNPHQDFLPLVARQPCPVIGGDFEGARNLCAARARHGADYFATVRIEYLDVDQFSGDAHFFVSDSHSRCSM